MKYRHSVKNVLNISLTTVISYFSYALPLLLCFNLFFNMSGQRHSRATAEEKEGSTVF